LHAPTPLSSIQLPKQAFHEAAATLFPVASLFAFLFAFGANRDDLALLSTAVFGLQVLVLLSLKRMRQSSVWQSLTVPGALFLAAVVTSAWALTPFGPDGPHPLWSYITAAPAIALGRSGVMIGLVKLAGLACCFITGVMVCSSERRSRLFVRGLLVAGGLYGLWSLVAHAISPNTVLGVPNDMHGGRLTGSLFSANAAGTLFGLLLVVAIAQFLAEVQRGSARPLSLAWRSMLPSTAAALFAVCLALSTSRGAFGATVCGLLVLMIWTRFARNWRADKARNIFISVGYLALAGVLLVVGNVAVDRYATALQDWETQRTVIYTTHWSAFLASPWFGYGLGSFDSVNKLLMTSENYAQLWNVRAAHNLYLQWFEEAGLAGALPMFAATGWVLFVIGRGAVRRRSNRSKVILRGLFAASVVVLVHSWSDFAVQVPAIAALWALLLGCGTAIALSSRDADPAGHAVHPHRVGQFWSGVASPIAACAGIGAVSLVAGSVLFAELAFPSFPAVVPLGSAYAGRAVALLSKRTITPPDLVAAERFAGQELAQNPASVAGWLRLADAKVLRTGAVGEGVSALIERSFLVGPLDPDVFEWRTRFALEHWNSVSPAVRDDVLAGIRASWLVWPQKMWLGHLAPTIANPAGRLALTLAVGALNAGDAAARRVAQSDQIP
jgi:O-antigen ligase